jgi:hypothetical protein
MVTLLGFAFILVNVACLAIWMPDLVGPVRFEEATTTTLLPDEPALARLLLQWTAIRFEAKPCLCVCMCVCVCVCVCVC